MKSEPCQKAKHLMRWSHFNSTITSGHVLWPETKRTKARVRAAKMSFALLVGWAQTWGNRRWGAWGKAAAAVALPHGTSWYSHLIKPPPPPDALIWLSSGDIPWRRNPTTSLRDCIFYLAKRCFWLPCRSHGIWGWMDTAYNWMNSPQCKYVNWAYFNSA